MIFVSDVISMWIKIGVAGSVVWTFLLYLVSWEEMKLVKDFYFNWNHPQDASLPLIIIGCVIIWLLSFLFVRKKATD